MNVFFYPNFDAAGDTDGDIGEHVTLVRFAECKAHGLYVGEVVTSVTCPASSCPACAVERSFESRLEQLERAFDRQAAANGNTASDVARLERAFDRQDHENRLESLEGRVLALSGHRDELKRTAAQMTGKIRELEIKSGESLVELLRDVAMVRRVQDRTARNVERVRELLEDDPDGAELEAEIREGLEANQHTDDDGDPRK